MDVFMQRDDSRGLRAAFLRDSTKMSVSFFFFFLFLILQREESHCAKRFTVRYKLDSSKRHWLLYIGAFRLLLKNKIENRILQSRRAKGLIDLLSSWLQFFLRDFIELATRWFIPFSMLSASFPISLYLDIFQDVFVSRQSWLLSFFYLLMSL